MSIIEDLPPAAPKMQRVWQGKMASSPTSVHELVDVFLDGYPDNLRWKRCRWQPRFEPVSLNVAESPEAAHIIETAQVILPVRGNPCLCIFDNDRNIWVVMYWPY